MKYVYVCIIMFIIYIYTLIYYVNIEIELQGEHSILEEIKVATSSNSQDGVYKDIMVEVAGKPKIDKVTGIWEKYTRFVQRGLEILSFKTVSDKVFLDILKTYLE